jgi:hypothetical protein
MTIERYRLNIPVRVEVARVTVNGSSLRAVYSTNAPIFSSEGELFIEYPTSTNITDDRADPERGVSAQGPPFRVSGKHLISFQGAEKRLLAGLPCTVRPTA